MPRDADEALAEIVATLQRHRDLLTGSSWLERADLDAAFEEGMRQRGLLPETPVPPELTIAGYIEHARAVMQQLGFATEYDSTTLSPHESLMSETFRFRRGATAIELLHSDTRVPDEWSLSIDGEVVACGWEQIGLALDRVASGRRGAD